MAWDDKREWQWNGHGLAEVLGHLGNYLGRVSQLTTPRQTGSCELSWHFLPHLCVNNVVFDCLWPSNPITPLRVMLPGTAWHIPASTADLPAAVALMPSFVRLAVVSRPNTFFSQLACIPLPGRLPRQLFVPCSLHAGSRKPNSNDLASSVAGCTYLVYVGGENRGRKKGKTPKKKKGLSCFVFLIISFSVDARDPHVNLMFLCLAPSSAKV